MTDDSDPVLTDLLRRLGVASPHDLTQGSAEVVQFLAEIAAVLNTLAVSEFGGRLGAVRQHGLLEQVIGAAFQSYGDVYPHTGPFDKAAMLFRGVISGHPFQDGNKRTGFLLVAFFLERLGYPLPDSLDVDIVERLCVAISSGEMRDIEEITNSLISIWHQA